MSNTALFSDRGHVEVRVVLQLGEDTVIDVVLRWEGGHELPLSVEDVIDGGVRLDSAARARLETSPSLQALARRAAREELRRLLGGEASQKEAA